MSDLAAIRAREQAATPGPWTYKPLKHYRHEAVVSPGSDHPFVVWLPDAEFIAHARMDIPWLCDQVDRLTAENARLRAALEAIISYRPEHVEPSAELVEAIDRCEGCVRARTRGWPPSGLCEAHYTQMRREVWGPNERAVEYQALDMRDIARRALEATEPEADG